MKTWMMGILLMSALPVRSAVMISDSFTAAENTALAGRLTPVGGYTWAQTAGQGTFRIAGNTVVTQNNVESGKNPVAYLDYT